MKYNIKKQRELYSHKVILDARTSVLHVGDGRKITLAELYKDIDSDDAVDRIRDSVRQLVQARVNGSDDTYIGKRRESICEAIGRAAKWSRSGFFQPTPEMDLNNRTLLSDATNSIDASIIESVSRHESDRAICAAGL